MRKRFLALTVCLWPTVLAAQPEQMPIGIGTSPCKEFNTAVASGDHDTTGKFLEWAMGYVTGRSDEGATLDGEVPEAFSDVKAVYNDLVPQCAGNENDRFVDAVRETAANVFGR